MSSWDPCVILCLVLLSFSMWSIAVQWSRDLPVWSLLQGSSVSLGLELRDARPVHGHAFFSGHLSNPQPLSLYGKDEEFRQLRIPLVLIPSALIVNITFMPFT